MPSMILLCEYIDPRLWGDASPMREWREGALLATVNYALAALSMLLR